MPQRRCPAFAPANPAFAARAWWVLRRLGVADVRYLDGAAEVARTGVLIDSLGGEDFSDGHIPGAVHLPAAEALDAQGKLPDDDTIRAQFATAGVDLDDKGKRVGAFSAWLADPARPVATA